MKINNKREKFTFFMPLVFFDEVSCSWSAFLFYKKKTIIYVHRTFRSNGKIWQLGPIPNILKHFAHSFNIKSMPDYFCNEKCLKIIFLAVSSLSFIETRCTDGRGCNFLLTVILWKEYMYIGVMIQRVFFEILQK